MSKKKTTWDRVKDLSLANQVKALCECLDEVNEAEPIPTEPKPEPKPKEK